MLDKILILSIEVRWQLSRSSVEAPLRKSATELAMKYEL